MPFGADPADGRRRRIGTRLRARLAELTPALPARGLELADVAQGRCWDGVPFIFDLVRPGAAR